VEIYAMQALNGLVYGMFLFLLASGLTLILGMMGVLNIAHMSFYMLGAYIAYSITHSFGFFWLNLLICPLVVGVLGMLVERFFIRKTYLSGHLSQLLLTFGLYFVISEIIRLIWGTQLLRLPEPEPFTGVLPFLGMTYPIYRLFILGLSCLVLIGMILVLARTRIGIIIRAAVSDAEMVNACGHNIPLYYSGVFAGGTMLAALAGVIVAPFLTIFSGMGDQMLMDCFVVIIVGGLGSLTGTFIASLLIGQLQSFGTMWIPDFALVLQFLLLVVVLAVRPTGLLGDKP
jgi:branched-chain amino acid transport system permease protein